MIDVKNKIVACDFDGTVVTHEYPNMGKDVPGAVSVLKELVEKGARLILYTMRSDDKLQDAVNWFKEREIPLWGINENPEQKSWTNSPKIYAHDDIDDAALGVPLFPGLRTERPYVDWNEVSMMIFGAPPRE